MAGLQVEAWVDPGQGTVANVLVKRGTLGVGEFIAAGTQWGKVKRLLGSDAQPMRSAGPSAPVQIVGLKGCPETSDSIVACDSEKAAKERAEARIRAAQNQQAAAAEVQAVQQRVRTEARMQQMIDEGVRLD